MNHKNGSFSSSLGFVLACVGSAVGLGNIWMFPYRLGQYGGGAFFLIYLLFILLFGEFFYVWLGGDVRHKMNLAFCAAFFVVLFVVLLVVTEGDIADGIGDAFVGGSAGEKKRKRRGRLK